MSDIVHRTVEKDEKLATLRDHRDHVNACKSLERKLDLDLKREKVSLSLVCSGVLSLVALVFFLWLLCHTLVCFGCHLRIV